MGTRGNNTEQRRKHLGGVSAQQGSYSLCQTKQNKNMCTKVMKLLVLSLRAQNGNFTCNEAWMELKVNITLSDYITAQVCPQVC